MALYDVMRAALERLGQPLQEHPDDGWIGVPGGDGWDLIAEAHEDRDQVVVYAIAEATVPEERRTDVARELHRINYGLYLGNFELDLEDGEVRFKASVDFGGTPPTPELIRPLLAAATMTATRYLPDVEAV
jgi:hypothetical protein